MQVAMVQVAMVAGFESLTAHQRQQEPTTGEISNLSRICKPAIHTSRSPNKSCNGAGAEVGTIHNLGRSAHILKHLAICRVLLLCCKGGVTMRPFKPYTCRGKTPRNAFSLEGLRAVGFIPGRLDPQDTPEDNAHKIAKLKIVLREIIQNELTDIQKDVVLDCLTGKTQREIAEERGIHESTVSRHRTKAMKTLKKFGRYISPFLR